MSYSNLEKQQLRQIVDDTITYGLAHHTVKQITITDYAQKLQENAASFVTLEINGALRGCIGSLEAYQPLAVDVAHNAFAAAFEDPRFSPLTPTEYPKITKHISVLSKPEPMSFSSEADLLSKIQPNIDGLILQERGYRGTFLPAVWEQLPSPRAFLQHLKMKAGLPIDYWSATIKIYRYTTEVI